MTANDSAADFRSALRVARTGAATERYAMPRALRAVDQVTRWMIPVLIVVLSSASSRAQTFEELQIPLTIPSPNGNLIVYKHYPPGGRWTFSVSLAPKQSPSNLIALVGGMYPRGERGSDGVLVGWNGNTGLVIGWPKDHPVTTGPQTAFGVDIRYLNYPPDSSGRSSSPIKILALKEVVYNFRKVLLSSGNTECGIHIEGSDGSLYDKVSIDVVGHGTGEAHLQPSNPKAGTGSVSVSFALGRLETSPFLTLTQGAIIDSSSDRDSILVDPLFTSYPTQDANTIRYDQLNIHQSRTLFERMGSQTYDVFLSLTFGSQTIVYRVKTPVPDTVANSYIECENSTNIFLTEVGQALRSGSSR